MTNNNLKIKFVWKGRAITSPWMIKRVWRSKRAVSPVIAIVLLIALTVASAAVVWTLTSGILEKENVEMVLDSYAVADTDGDKEGDLIELQIRNIGSDKAKITEVKLFRDDSQQATWTMEATSYEVLTIAIVRIQTIDSSQQVTNSDTVRVEVKESVVGNLVVAEIKIPSVLSSIPVYFDGGDFSTIDINSNGWTEYTYNTHGGGSGISVVGNDLVFATNDDILFYLKNDTFTVQNGIITAQFKWGDNDAIGIAFRIIDEFNYYWVGFTEDHNGPANRAGESESTYTGPWFINDGKFELHKLVNGVDTLLAAATPSTFTIPPGTSGNPSGPFDFVISFSGQSLSFQAAGPTGILEEIFSITDSTFANAGYFGVFSIAAASSVLSNFEVTS